MGELESLRGRADLLEQGLASQAALKAGAGLVTLYATDDIYSIVAAKAETEVMVKPVTDLRQALSDRLDAIAIGPGLGRARADEVLQIIREFANPMVVDADALNIISERPKTFPSSRAPVTYAASRRNEPSVSTTVIYRGRRS